MSIINYAVLSYFLGSCFDFQYYYYFDVNDDVSFREDRYVYGLSVICRKARKPKLLVVVLQKLLFFTTTSSTSSKT